jgi:UPF0755 protein
VVGLAGFIYLTTPPLHFLTNDIVTIEEGDGLSSISASLHTKGIVRSPLIFRFVITILGDERSIVEGDYYIEKPLNVFQVADRLTHGYYNMETRIVTIPEGHSIHEIAERFEDELLDFDVISFLKIARHKEGRLFPDTYELQPTISEEDLVEKMYSTFNSRIQEIGDEIDAFGRPLDEVIIMASILEREARRMVDRRRIAGVLWRRIEVDMPLQVDAVFSRVNGKNTYQLTALDLTTDSPFNTYTRKGLPPGPIGNPGLDSILAAVTPIESDNLYFLSDRSGVMYFSETFEEHVRKKHLYVR